VAHSIIADELGADVLLRGSDVCHFLQEALHNGSVSVGSIYSSILSCCGSKKISRV
jgi:hypothetical protein